MFDTLRMGVTERTANATEPNDHGLGGLCRQSSRGRRSQVMRPARLDRAASRGSLAGARLRCAPRPVPATAGGSGLGRWGGATGVRLAVSAGSPRRQADAMGSGPHLRPWQHPDVGRICRRTSRPRIRRPSGAGRPPVAATSHASASWGTEFPETHERAMVATRGRGGR